MKVEDSQTEKVKEHTKISLTVEEMATALEKMTKPAPESVPLQYPIDESKVI